MKDFDIRSMLRREIAVCSTEPDRKCDVRYHLQRFHRRCFEAVPRTAVLRQQCLRAGRPCVPQLSLATTMFVSLAHLMKAVYGIAPSALEDQLIPLRDEVVNWASRMCLTERSAAVHTACRLYSSLDFIVARVVDLPPVEHSLQRVTVRVGVTVVVDETTSLVNISKSAVTALDLGSVIGCVRLVAPDLVILSDGEASLLLPSGSRLGGGSGGGGSDRRARGPS